MNEPKASSKKELSLDEKVDRDTKRMLKRLKRLEATGFTYKESKSNKEKNRRIKEKLDLRLKETYIRRFKCGEIGIAQMPKDLFPELFEPEVKVDDRQNWQEHIHHHLRCEITDHENGVNVFCHTCSDNPEGKLITNFFKSEDEFIKFFRSNNKKTTRSHPFYKCNYCKCQISVKNFYKKYQMHRCPSCESYDISKMREIELHDKEIFTLLSKRERIRLELKKLIEDKTKELEQFDYLDNREVIYCKEPKIDKVEYANELRRRTIRIVLKDNHILTDSAIVSKLKEEENKKRDALPKYEKSRWEEKKRYKKRGRKLKL
jgi:hypothetical protein